MWWDRSGSVDRLTPCLPDGVRGAALLQALCQPPVRLSPFPCCPVWAGETASVFNGPLGEGLPVVEGVWRHGRMSDPWGLPGERAELVLERGWCIAFPRWEAKLVESGSLKCSCSPGAASSTKSCMRIRHGVLWGQAVPLRSGGRGEHPSVRAGCPCVLGGLSCRAFGSPLWKEGGKEGRKVELVGASVTFFTHFFFTCSGSQVPGRDSSSMAAATESRHQPPSTNCFGSRPR